MPNADDLVLRFFSAHFPPEIHHHLDEIDDLCQTIEESMRGRRTIRLSGGDLNVELAEDAGDDAIGTVLIQNVTDR